MTRPRLLAATLATCTALVAGPAFANETLDDVLDQANEVTKTTVDLFLLRPLGIGRLAFGAAVAMPFSSAINLIGLPFGQDTSVFTDDWDRYVVQPAEYTFSRRVGKDLAGL